MRSAVVPARLAEIIGARELLWNLTLRELRSKYKRSVLGWAWSMLNPIAVMTIYSVVFRVVMRVEPELGDPSGLHNYALFLLAGLLPFNFMSNALMQGMGALVNNAALVKKVYFPREVMVVSATASWVVSFFIELAILAVALVIAGAFVLPMLPLVLLVVAVQATFVLGLGLVLGILTVYFRDLEHLTGLGLQVWFYASPVIYPLAYVTERLDRSSALFRLYEANPMVGFVEVYRDLLYHVRMPSGGTVVYLVLVSIATLVAGLLVFNRYADRVAEEL